MEIGKFLSACSYQVYLNLRLIYWYFEALFRYFVPPPLKSLDGETILITGGAGGIGREICRSLVESTSNLKLIIWDVNRKGLDEVAEELQQKRRGVQVYTYQVDISSRGNIKKTSELVRNDVGNVSVVINNAGVAPFGKFLEITNSEIEQTIQINLLAQIWIVREFLGDMMTRNYGRIVNICSTAALTTGFGGLPYFASKYAVNGYTEALRTELAHFHYDGIHVTTVYPNFTRTPLSRSLNYVDIPRLGYPVPSSMTRFLEPELVGREVVNGMRRELEYVYVPKEAAGLPLADLIFPMKQRKYARKEVSRCVIYENLEDRRKVKHSP